MRLRGLVPAAAVEAAIFALVPVVGRHFGERLEAERRLAALLRLLGFALLPEANRLDDRPAVAALDGDGHFGAFLEFLRLEAVRERLAVGAEDFDVRVDPDGAILPIR